jgi:salicylate hydroxylase
MTSSIPNSSSDAQNLHVIVIGAGICGLSAATALRTHYRVTVLEQSALNEEAGAAVTTNPSCTRILESWGFSFEEIKSPEFKVFQSYTPDGKIYSTVPMNSKERYRYGHYMNHRVDIHQRK